MPRSAALSHTGDRPVGCPAPRAAAWPWPPGPWRHCRALRLAWQFGLAAAAVLLSLFASPARAAAPAQAGQALTVDYFEDAAGQLSAAQVQALPGAAWRQLLSTQASFGYTRSVYWFRIALPAQAGGGAQMLEISSPVLVDIRL